MSQGRLSNAAATIRRNIGSYLPIHLSSVGIACLASMPQAEQEFILDAIRPKHRDDWLKIRRGLDKALKDYDDYGYCFSISEMAKRRQCGCHSINASY